jgi:glycosyltransferase involved in cell wall biosynthesis
LRNATSWRSNTFRGLDEAHQRHIVDLLRDIRERLEAAGHDLSVELEERRIPTHPNLRRLLAIERRMLDVERALQDDLEVGATRNEDRPPGSLLWRLGALAYTRARATLAYTRVRATAYARLRGLAAPLGVRYHHPPIPLKVPTRYLATDPPNPAPTLSIVTPSFGQGEYIERTLYSVLNQNYPSLEYVVQDGGSKDDTIEILRRYEPFLAHWASEPDKGQADALNRGFAHTRGEIMAYLNSDDLLLPGSLAYVSRYFASHPEVDAVYGHRVMIDVNDGQVGIWVLPRHDDQVLSLLDFVPQETLFWRRSAWEKAGGQIDASLDFAIDWDLLLRLAESGAKIVRLPRFLGAFRVHEQQKSTLMEDLFLIECDKLRRRVHGRTISHDEAAARVTAYQYRHIVYLAWERVKMFLLGPRTFVRTQPLEPWFRGPDRDAGLVGALPPKATSS